LRGKTRASDGPRFDGTVVQVCAFDEEKRVTTGVADLSNLWPEPVADECAVQVEHCLALDERLPANIEVA